MSLLRFETPLKYKYHHLNIMKNIKDIYSKILKSIYKSDEAIKIFDKYSEKFPEINMMYLIINNYTFIDEDNKYMILNYVIKLEKLDKMKNGWTNKIEKLRELSLSFVNNTIDFTGINMLLTIKEKDNNYNMNAEDIYDICNNFKNVVYCTQVSQNAFCLSFLHNEDAKMMSDFMNNKELEYAEEEYKYTITTRFVQPSIPSIINQYDWNNKKKYNCIYIPFNKKTIIPVKEIVNTCELLRR
jgi:hypothetical protein